MKPIRYRVAFDCHEHDVDEMSLPCIKKLMNEEYEWAFDVWYDVDAPHYIEFHSTLTSAGVLDKLEGMLTDGVHVADLWRGEYSEDGYWGLKNPNGTRSGRGTIIDSGERV